MMKNEKLNKLLKKREFAYSEVFVHELVGQDLFDEWGVLKATLDPEMASKCKNESNNTVIFDDGTMMTTWGQGSSEMAFDESVVYSISHDTGMTWSEPRRFLSSEMDFHIAYGAPFIVPNTQRIYFFFLLGGKNGDGSTGNFHFVFSDNRGKTWSEPYLISLPDRFINMYRNYVTGWLNHGPQRMGDTVLLPISATHRMGVYRKSWCLTPAEVSVISMPNILYENNPENLVFNLYPEGPYGLRLPISEHIQNPALKQLNDYFGGEPEENAYNMQELTVTKLPDGRIIGVARTYIGSPAFAVSSDNGKTWTKPEALRYAPDGDLILHPCTMCPIASLTDGRVFFMFTNNDGSMRNAHHVWDGNGTTRNPQWFVIGRQIPGVEKNAGLIFGTPRILTEVDESGPLNLKTGVSMPQFFEFKKRYFVCYNINKEHILLDEIPAGVIDEMTPMTYGG